MHAAVGQFERLLAEIPPRTVHVILTTPLGTAIIDPFAADGDGVRQWLERFGITATVRFGAPTAEELAQPSLVENLKLLGLLLGGLGLVWLLRR